MLQEARAIESDILRQKQIYKEYMYLCWVATLFGMICC